ncbi:gamma-aminobutyric acid receptor subunit alpha-6-like [Tubulanus polymorphus]|uniref:gamma-aminobutyric acid receptor subunit alpha-6-like n=1 Tax=Tubulanus polymorphus TaxID=672921 RepID=UPI003DA2FBC2
MADKRIVTVSMQRLSTVSPIKLSYLREGKHPKQNKNRPINATQQLIIKNVSNILTSLMKGYQKTLRPGYGGPPVIIKSDINIRSMGPISEADMAYSMDCYFRQTWEDDRLRFRGPMPMLSVHNVILEKIWKPDTYFTNGRGAYVHTITTPNKLLRIYQNGTVLYSMRLTIKASCPMYLQFFPIDEQLCPLVFRSYAYTKEDIAYLWKYGPNKSVKISDDMRLSQFDLSGFPQDNFTELRMTGEYSSLRVQFQLQRHMGYFLIQVYVPCTLIVVLSWVSFWLNREATADRIGLGITTVLTLTTLSMDSRENLPKVKYATALDWFIIMCFSYIIATMLEFAAVHYFTKIGYGEVQHESDSSDDSSDDETDDDDEVTRADVVCNNDRNLVYNYTTPRANHQSSNNIVRGYGTNNSAAVIHAVDTEERKFSKRSLWCDILHCLKGSARYKNLIVKQRTRQGAVNSVSTVDKVARILFPLSFAALNIAYWIAYTKSDAMTLQRKLDKYVR